MTLEWQPVFIPAIWFIFNCAIAWPSVLLANRIGLRGVTPDSTSQNKAMAKTEGHLLAWFIPTLIWCIATAVCLGDFGSGVNWSAFWVWTVLYAGTEIVNFSVMLIGIPEEQTE